MRSRIGRLGLLALLTLLATIAVFLSRPGPGRKDFFSFVFSGRAIMEGANPYARDIDPTLTPPFTLPLLSLLARLDPWSAYVGWWLFSIPLYVTIALVLLRAYPERRSPTLLLWTVAYAPFACTLAGGQVYIVLLALTAVAWLALRDDRPMVAGVALGFLVALKPNFALWPFLLLVTGVAVPALVAFAVAAFLTVAPMLWYGWRIVPDWLNRGSYVADLMPGSYGEMSIRGVFARFGLDGIGIVIAVAVILAVSVWAWRRRLPPLEASAVALVGSLIAAPLAWPGYAVTLLPVLIARPWNLPMRAGAILFTFPFPIAMALGGTDPRHPATGLYAVALVGLLIGVLTRRTRQMTAAVPSRSARTPRRPVDSPAPVAR